MKLRSAQDRRKWLKGSNKRGRCAKGNHRTKVGKRKRQRRSDRLGSGDTEALKFQECVCGARKAGEDAKEEGSSRGKCKKNDVGHGKGRNGKGRKKGSVVGIGGDGVDVRGTVKDMILHSRSTLRNICALHGSVTQYQRDAVMGTTLRLVQEFGEMAMERHLTLALIQSWDPWRIAFRIIGRQVRFMVFDVVLFTGLRTTGRIVELDGAEVSMEVGNMVRARMAEWERQEMARTGKSGKKRYFFRHYVNVMMELCEENAEKDRIGIWLRLYAFIALSGMFFPHTPYGAAWSLLHYTDNVEGMGQYARVEAIWREVWFYEHMTRFCSQDGERFPWIASWRKGNHGGIYDENELLAELEEKEVNFDTCMDGNICEDN
ncbi:hypothetical protein Cgig2_015019 [Carnegiea gigantea]|uniref:Uncharacterized protein n=1 Tax=Carnegiea gigantea TaxID=171969 RepID=A0A9Q1JRQ8_9CARY|nr:hypothetical protein Cgig2_015019 [Carnegiea gigantea]